MANLITGYNAICNIGQNIDEIYKNAISGTDSCFDYIEDIIKGTTLRTGRIKTELKEINNPDFDTRCNKLILKNLELLESNLKELFKKYKKEEIGVIAATTNTGVEEYETTKNKNLAQQGNPSLFVKEYLNLSNYHTTVSTACSSGIKAFSLASDLLDSDFLKAVIVVGIDAISKLPLFGFNSLEILSSKPSNPLSINYTGINIAEAVCCFTVEKEENTTSGIKILSIGESTDTNHFTTPDPEAKEAKAAILEALKCANLKPSDIDYINLHGTGTLANDTMEARAIYDIFNNTVPVSSTKQLTGHCLGAASALETAMLCKLLDNFEGKLFPHIYDGYYNPNLPEIRLVKKDELFKKCKICMNNSFGFGGCNAILILGK